MAEEKKPEPKPFFTTERVTLYAPKGAKHHRAGEKTLVQARQKEKFLKKGFTETAPDALKEKGEGSADGEGAKTMTTK